MPVVRSDEHIADGISWSLSSAPRGSEQKQRVVVDKAWRCDLHPAWSRDHQWITINGRPSGGDRQVVLVYLGPDLSVYFPDERIAAVS